ncbi:MAG: N-acetylmuramoyl-L-alanine amidase [Bacilli bacterium]|nr:N-acetylmuramoyl-L-alanine amidase [Bacilli bacterium]
MNIIKNLVPQSKYNIKCPYEMKAEYISVHNTANDATARNEIAYMISNDNEVSFHIAVDDKEAVQGLPLDRNGWHCGDGNGTGNMKSIGIEICYSKSGGDKFIKAEQNAVQLIAQLLKERGWGIDRVKKHQDWSGKYCPHRTLDMGWDRFIKMIESALNGAKNEPTNEVNNITYQTWDDVKNKWLPNVINDSDYAGIFGHDVCCVYANLDRGNVYYKVHYKGGKWLPEVKNRNDYAGIYNKPIDGFMIKGDKPLRYRVHLRKQNRWLPWVTGYNQNDKNNGYAGILGQEIDAIQIK